LNYRNLPTFQNMPSSHFYCPSRIAWRILCIKTSARTDAAWLTSWPQINLPFYVTQGKNKKAHPLLGLLTIFYKTRRKSKASEAWQAYQDTVLERCLDYLKFGTWIEQWRRQLWLITSEAWLRKVNTTYSDLRDIYL
jgi:hypothetical protein